MYYGGFTYTECYKVPSRYRRWFLDRIIKEIKRSAGRSRSAQDNDAETRAQLGMTRLASPARTRRFT